MHFLSAQNRSEFLACPQLVRLDYAKGQDGFEPTLLVKGSTLLLKYIVRGIRMQFAVARLGNRLMYGLMVFDDPSKGAMLWSILERREELAALRAMSRGEPCQVFLFNEIAVNLAWVSIPITVPALEFEALADGIETGKADHSSLDSRVGTMVDQLQSNVTPDNAISIEIPGITEWNPVRNTFITNSASASLLDFFGQDEGNHQEQIGIWLTDNLHPNGAYHSPQVPKGLTTRELTDILLTYEYGSILLESKTLSIFARDNLPDRAKLTKDVSGHVAKAVSQLRGGIRKIKSGEPVTTRDGAVIDVERTQPIHAIVLIPDLELIENPEDYGIEFIAEFMEATGGYLHILDISELLRIVQAAEMIAARGTETTPMMAFDYYLIERAKKCAEAGTLCIEVLLRFEDQEPG